MFNLTHELQDSSSCDTSGITFVEQFGALNEKQRQLALLLSQLWQMIGFTMHNTALFKLGPEVAQADPFACVIHVISYHSCDAGRMVTTTEVPFTHRSFLGQF